MRVTDEELSEIAARDALRKKHVNEYPLESKALSEIIAGIIYAPGINNGNIYADWLAARLLETNRISVK